MAAQRFTVCEPAQRVARKAKAAEPPQRNTDVLHDVSQLR